MTDLHQAQVDLINTKLVGCTTINIILGRNGAGKSRFLRELDVMFRDNNERIFYVSPERAGVFKRDISMSSNIENNPNYLHETRRKNQADNFKAASAHRLRELRENYDSKILRTPELRYQTTASFETSILPRISGLLANIRIESAESGFVFKNSQDEEVSAQELSSGESEAITLATEILTFFENLDQSRRNVLLLDEPDVHLHPDLQARLGHFILNSVDQLSDTARAKTVICIATHSTAFVSSIASSPLTSIGVKNFGNDTVKMEVANDQVRKVAPFFGHPLSLALSNDTMLILEGEDDERVFQQAGRSSQGRIKVFPVLATSVNQQTELEAYCDKVVSAIFDDPVAYSLRDGDGKSGELPNIGIVKRFRLNCYAIENMLLTDECLVALGCQTWEGFVSKAQSWIDANPNNQSVQLVKDLLESSDRLRNHKIKSIRDIICAICGVKKPWEVIVGQCLGRLQSAKPVGEHSLAAYMGEEAARTLLSLPN